MTSLRSILLCFACLIVFCAGRGWTEEPPVVPVPPKGPPKAAPALPSYRWTPKTIYRFQYQKTISVTRVLDEEAASSEPKPKPRTTDFNGVLVIDVDTVDEDGAASAVLRFDSPRIQMAPMPTVDPEKGQLDVSKDRDQIVSMAMNETLRDARWRVNIAKDGCVTILSRTPEKITDLLQKISAAGVWRKKAMQDLYSFLENHLKLGTSGRDEEVLFCLGASPAPQADVEGFDALRPKRVAGAAKAKDDERIEMSAERVMPKASEPDKPIQIANLDPDEPPVFVIPGKVENNSGRAIFDAQTGMLDSASEKFLVGLTVRIESKKRRVESTQKVQVEYKLTRLAPPIRTNEPAEEDRP